RARIALCGRSRHRAARFAGHQAARIGLADVRQGCRLTSAGGGREDIVTDIRAVAERPSLYERLGGLYSIATVVEDLIDRLMVDPRLNANPRVDEAHHKVPSAGFKYLVTEMLCWAAGGPQRYSGRSMEESHRGMAITPSEWQ